MICVNECVQALTMLLLSETYSLNLHAHTLVAAISCALSYNMTPKTNTKIKYTQAYNSYV